METPLTLRDQFIISQALYYGSVHLRALEDRDEKYPPDGEHAEPSNRQDMESLRKQVFPLYISHERLVSAQSERP